MKLLTLSDGYGDSKAVPAWYPKYWKWPEIIKLMTKGIELKNCSRYGAGNEFIVNTLKQNIDSADVVMIQWAQPNRLDLVLTQNNNNFWSKVIASDPIYNNNIVNVYYYYIITACFQHQIDAYMHMQIQMKY